MKKLVFLFAMMAVFTMNAMAQTPWKIVDMEDVSKHGGNAEYDDETTTVSFKGNSDRWIDLPGVSGDLTEHTKLNITVEKSDVILKIAVRYKDEEGKTKQADAFTLWGRMGKPIEKSTVLKLDLLGKGSKVTPEMLKNVVSIRVAMAKPCADKTEPWSVKFGEVAIF